MDAKNEHAREEHKIEFPDGDLYSAWFAIVGPNKHIIAKILEMLLLIYDEIQTQVDYWGYCIGGVHTLDDARNITDEALKMIAKWTAHADDSQLLMGSKESLDRFMSVMIKHVHPSVDIKIERLDKDNK